jgi:hypothetical protein
LSRRRSSSTCRSSTRGDGGLPRAHLPVSFALVGFIIGIWARNFEQLQLVPLLIVTPLVFLGGAFYSISMLPPLWQTVTLFNPVVYLISGFRWSFFGTAMCPWGSAFWRSRLHRAVPWPDLADLPDRLPHPVEGLGMEHRHVTYLPKSPSLAEDPPVAGRLVCLPGEFYIAHDEWLFPFK